MQCPCSHLYKSDEFYDPNSIRVPNLFPFLLLLLLLLLLTYEISFIRLGIRSATVLLRTWTLTSVALVIQYFNRKNLKNVLTLCTRGVFLHHPSTIYLRNDVFQSEWYSLENNRKTLLIYTFLTFDTRASLYFRRKKIFSFHARNTIKSIIFWIFRVFLHIICISVSLNYEGMHCPHKCTLRVFQNKYSIYVFFRLPEIFTNFHGKQ